MNSFVTRVLSALVGLVIIVFTHLYFGELGLKVILAIVVLISIMELSELLFQKNVDVISKKIITIGTVFLVFALSCWMKIYSGLFLIVGFVIAYTALFLLRVKNHLNDSDLKIQKQISSKESKPNLLREDSEIQFQKDLNSDLLKVLLAIVYLGILPSSLSWILDRPKGELLVFCLLSIVFTGDVCAYLIGSKYGKTRILPHISPKKSLEGSLAGLLGSVCAGFIFSVIWLNENTLLISILALFVGVTAQVGDLFESLLKRLAHVKDSGRVMPGHGGFLDRIDALLFASPIFMIGTILFSHFQ